MSGHSADRRALSSPPVSTNEGRQHPRRRAWRWPALGLVVWALVGLLGLTVLLSMVGGSSSSMGLFILAPLILGGGGIWIVGLFVLLVWLLTAAMSAEPPARAVAVIAAVALVLLAAGGLAGLIMMGATTDESASNIGLDKGRVPPVGAIWFGSVYNSDTHGLEGCPADVTVGCEAASTDRLYALVAHLPRAVHEAVDIRWGGSATPHTKTAPADGEFLVVWGFGFTEPGYNTVSIIDGDGNSLASSGMDIWGP